MHYRSVLLYCQPVPLSGNHSKKPVQLESAVRISRLGQIFLRLFHVLPIDIWAGNVTLHSLGEWAVLEDCISIVDFDGRRIVKGVADGLADVDILGVALLRIHFEAKGGRGSSELR